MLVKKLAVLLTLALATWLPACSDDDGASHTGPDAALDAASLDAAVFDSGLVDAAPEDGAAVDAATDGGEVDSATVDSGTPVDWGVISGECGVLDDAEWTSPDPFLFANAIDFGTVGFDIDLLTPGGYEIWVDGNLGGSSIHSEILSYEILNRCELAELIKTEAEILYQDPGGKKTDILVLIDGRKVGVSVVRAYHYPPDNPYTVEEAEALLTSKLSDVLLSAANADPADAWVRSILHVVAYDAQYASVVVTAFANIDVAIKADTILFVTVTNGEDEFVY